MSGGVRGLPRRPFTNRSICRSAENYKSFWQKKLNYSQLAGGEQPTPSHGPSYRSLLAGYGFGPGNPSAVSPTMAGMAIRTRFSSRTVPVACANSARATL